MGVDYSQIDLRALAHLSQDENLLNAFRHNEDIHTATAAQLYGVRWQKSHRTCAAWPRQSISGSFTA